MSRQIRYRAWIGSENTNFIDMPMHYEYEVECIYEGKYATVENGWDIQGVYENVPLEQDTGLKDKNGNSIWEGDIVEGTMGVFEVKWDDTASRFGFEPNMSMDWHPAFVCDQVNEMEVIGNIHENPELLEEK